MPKLVLKNEAETVRLGEAIARHVLPGDCIGLVGGLGVGKTSLARAIIQSRQGSSDDRFEVPSPSFSLVQTYRIGGVEFWHADLYRLGEPSEIHELGWDEAFCEAICLVEWADLLAEAMPERILLLTLGFSSRPDGRDVVFDARGAGWEWTDQLMASMGETTE